MIKKILIDVYPDGSSKVDADGFKGASCSPATKELEMALAGSTSNVEDKRKPDYYQSITPTQTQRGG